MRRADITGIVARELDKCMELGISQRALSRLSGVDSASISRFMSGQTDITIKTAQKLANAIFDWRFINRRAMSGRR